MLDIKVNGDQRTYIVGFFGDNAKERLTNPDGRLGPFRCLEMENYIIQGAAHSLGGEFFLHSVDLVRLWEKGKCLFFWLVRHMFPNLHLSC